MAAPHTADRAGSGDSTAADEAVRALSDPATYAERPRRVVLRETHISWVFLTERYAYKLKKPLAFEFVDYCTSAARRRACEDEVRLNRRLARDVYLGVVPLLRDASGRLRLGGEERAADGLRGATAVDWLVKMRRLPDDRMLDQLIESGRLRPAEIDALAAMLVNFYGESPPLVLQPTQYRAEIERHVRANRAELLLGEHGLPAAAVRRVHTAQLLFLAAMPEVLDARVCDGRIVDGHGDLRPEHVCLTRPPAIFDCLEFSPELRRLDVLDELGFLAMECDLLGAGWVGRRVLDTYLAASGDAVPDRLLWFYQSYRACVRAKVAALRAKQLAADNAAAAACSLRANARRYLQLAEDYARRIAPPVVIVARGLSGCGKTTLAGVLAQRLGLSRLGTDDVRRELLGPSPQPADYGQGAYQPAAREAVYDELLRRGADLLREGESVVLDGTFLTARSLRRVEELAAASGAEWLVLNCTCSPDLAQARIATRLTNGQDTSEARPELRGQQETELEAVPADMPAADVDTSGGIDVEAMRAWLRRLMASDEPVGEGPLPPSLGRTSTPRRTQTLA